jgi:hypothetical protein
MSTHYIGVIHCKIYYENLSAFISKITDDKCTMPYNIDVLFIYYTVRASPGKMLDDSLLHARKIYSKLTSLGLSV